MKIIQLLLPIWLILFSSVLIAKDLSSVNSDLFIEASDDVTDVNSVNGDIKIESGASVQNIDSVNGDITILEQARAGTIESVNGDIKLKKNAEVTGDIDTVNGNVSGYENASINGDLNSVNGNIKLTNTKLQGSIIVVNSDIHLQDGTVIEGSIRVKKPMKSWLSRVFGSSQNNKPKVTFGDNVIVKGEIIFEREVRLTVADSATLPTIQNLQ